MHEALGYEPEPGGEVVVMLGETQLLELLPVTDGEVLYAPADPSVTRRMPVAELEELARRMSR